MPEHSTDHTHPRPDDESSGPPRAPDPLVGLRLDAPGWPRWFEQVLAVGRSSPMAAALGGLALVVIVGLAGWLVWSGRSSPAPIETTLPTAPVSQSAPLALTTSVPSGPLMVHAAGAVAVPGVHELAPGSRVADLIDAAGGLLPEADGDRLNLAAPVVDGTRVYVPRVGEEIPTVFEDPVGSGAPATGDDVTSGEPADGLVDVNRADVDELDTLPGVGPATAQAIVDHRREHGPFARVDDLIDVRGIGEAKLAQLRDLVRV